MGWLCFQHLQKLRFWGLMPHSCADWSEIGRAYWTCGLLIHAKFYRGQCNVSLQQKENRQIDLWINLISVDNPVVKMAAFWDMVYHASEELLSFCMITHSTETIFSSCWSFCRFASSDVFVYFMYQSGYVFQIWGTFFVKGIRYVPKFGESGLGVGWG